MIPESERQRVEFSVVTKTKGILTKRFKITDGELVKDSSECYLQHGEVQKMDIMFSEIPAVLDALEPNQALVHGCIDQEHAVVVSQGVQSKYPGAVTRTKDVFTYPPYGILMMDYDAPETGGLNKSELIAAVKSLCPQFERAAMIWRPSASSCITDGDKIQLGIKNQRIYMPYDGTFDDMVDFIKAVEMRSWDLDQGWIFVSIAGTALPRCLFDTAVFSPERLDFAAGAVCDEPLYQTLPATEYYPGDFIDLTDYPDCDPARYRIQVEQEKIKNLDTINKIKKKYLEDNIDRAVGEQGITRRKARKVIEARMAKRLLPYDMLVANDGSKINIEDIILNPKKFHGMTVRDPLEPEYGPSKAKIYCDEDGIRVNSFAHGGRVFFVNFDKDYYIKWLRSLDEEVVADSWSDGLKNFYGTNVEKEKIFDEVKAITGASKSALKKDAQVIDDSKAKQLSVEIGDLTHHQLATMLMTEFPKHVVGTENQIFSYNGENCWKPTSLTKAKIKLCDKYDGLPRCSRTGDYNQITKHMYSLMEDDDFFANIPVGISTPEFHWKIEGNKLVNVAHDPSHRVRFLLPHNMAPEKYEMPIFENFLSWCFSDEKAQIMLLQEIFGAILFGVLNHQYQRAVLFRGDGSNGKGVVLDVLAALIPSHYISGVSPFQFSDPLFCSLMAGKMLNLVAELPKNRRIPSNDFKQVVDSGFIMGKRLYEQPFRFPVLASQIFSSNYDISTDDDSWGMRRRWLIVGFDNVIDEAERVPHLGDLLAKKEGAEILRWSSEGLIRLRENKKFTETRANAMYQKKMFDGVNNITAFMGDDDMVKTGDSKDKRFRVYTAGLYKAYQDWCADSGCVQKDIATKSNFNTHIEEKLKYETVRTSKGNMWAGIQLRV